LDDLPTNYDAPYGIEVMQRRKGEYVADLNSGGEHDAVV
jgi:hypothetical protein